MRQSNGSDATHTSDYECVTPSNFVRAKYLENDEIRGAGASFIYQYCQQLRDSKKVRSKTRAQLNCFAFSVHCLLNGALLNEGMAAPRSLEVASSCRLHLSIPYDKVCWCAKRKKLFGLNWVLYCFDFLPLTWISHNGGGNVSASLRIGKIRLDLDPVKHYVYAECKLCCEILGVSPS